jgi:hypothetical protein
MCLILVQLLLCLLLDIHGTFTMNMKHAKEGANPRPGWHTSFVLLAECHYISYTHTRSNTPDTYIPHHTRLSHYLYKSDDKP